MTDIVTFPCNYLVLQTGYTHRLLDMIPALTEFCAKFGVVPLCIQDSIDNDPDIIPFVINDGKIILDTEPPEELIATCNDIITRLQSNNCRKNGIVIFRVGNFANAADVFTHIQDLNYCVLFGVASMKFLQNNEGAIDIAYVQIHAESG